MKLRQINEVFERPSLDDVDVTIGYSSILYEFEELDIKYQVKVFLIIKNVKDFVMEQIGDKIANIEELEAKVSKFTENMALAASIFLSTTTEDDGKQYNKTGKGNQWSVYGKLIASVSDVVIKRRPAFLEFSGATADMDLVYNRFIKMSNKLDPNNSYSFYKGNSYIRNDLREMMENIGIDTQDEDENIKRGDKLKKAKNYKNIMRKTEES